MMVSQTTQELNDARNYWRSEGISAERLAIMDRATEQLISSGIRESASKAGDRVQDFILMDAHGAPLRLQALLDNGPVVISFYRGGWCPYCNIELRGLQRVLPEIKSLGASVIAISPQLPDNSLTTEENNKLTFPVLSDVGNVVARRFGIVFRLPPSLLVAYKDFGHELKTMNGDCGAEELPIPATFVLDRNGTIRLAYVEEDYTQRFEPQIVIDTLRKI